MLRRAIVNLCVLGLAGLMALGIAEILSRIIRPVSTVEYRMDADVGPMLVPHQNRRSVSQDYDVPIVTNSAGFHDLEHTLDKPQGVYRIAVLGDSYIEALQVPLEQNFGRQLERTIGGWVRSRPVEVINLGVSGSGPAQYYRILEKKGLEYRPDLVLMMVLPDNDFRDSSRRLGGAVFKPYYSIGADGALVYTPPQVAGLGTNLRPLLRRSAFLRLVRQALASLPVEAWLAEAGFLAPAGARTQHLDRAHAPIPEDWYVYVADPPAPWPEAYRITLRMIKESKNLAEQHGAKFLVVLIASTQMVEQRWDDALRPFGGGKDVTWDFEKPYREISVLGKESGFEVINLLSPFRQDFLTTGRSHSWPHDGHWNQQGHRLAAETVGRLLLQRSDEYHLN